MASLKLDITIDPVEIINEPVCPAVINLLKNVRPNWFTSEHYLQTLKCKVFTGGISNQLYGYYQEGQFDSDVVLVRVYGQGTELMIDRETEGKNVQTLHAAGCCPPLYAMFNNGIAYGFVNGVTLDESSVRDEFISKLIAQEMITLHKVRPEGQRPVAFLWDKINTFLELSPSQFDDPERQKKYAATIRPKEVLAQEVCELRKHLEPLDSPVVFCHNDLLVKNIIYSKEKGSVTFIDHEYAAYNYEHFELGNHFCEYAGVDNVDMKRYPDRDYQLSWLQYYLEQKAISEGRSGSDVTIKDVEMCYVMTNKFALAAHMFWGIWALVQAKHSMIDFGFLEYAEQRLNEYFARKGEFMALMLPI